jgi:hypothetical protein
MSEGLGRARSNLCTAHPNPRRSKPVLWLGRSDVLYPVEIRASHFGNHLLSLVKRAFFFLASTPAAE